MKGYITLLSSDNYIYYVLALYDSYLNTKSKYKFFCAVTDGVSDKIVKTMKDIGINIIKLDNTDIKNLIKDQKDKNMVTKYVNALSKLCLFNLEAFDKFVYLDSDLVLYQNIDELFDKPHLSAVEDCLPVHIRPKNYVLGESSFCSGLFVWEKDTSFYKKVVREFPSFPKHIKWHDQAILAYYNQDWMQRTELHLPCVYDLLVANRENILAKYDELYDRKDIKVKHYVSYKDAPYDTPKYIGDSVYNEYYRYFSYINDVLKKYKLEKIIKPINLANVKYKADRHTKIDIVLPYVDCVDINWQKTYKKFAPSTERQDVNGITRFRGQGEFFKYVFRGFDKHMPWINNVYLLVQSISQVPSWIDKSKVKIITHEQFIPKKYLPTFNSCTIEMFLWKIPGLSEKFIYINDDFYAIHALKPESFFADNKALFNIVSSAGWTMYEKQCRNCHAQIYGDRPETYKLLGHIFRPYFKTEMKICYDLNQKAIEESLSRFRETKNFNCYIYSLYLDQVGLRNNGVATKYLSPANVQNLNPQTIDQTLKAPTLCINDGDANIYVYKNTVLNKWFAEEFPTKCKYEIGGKAYTNRSSVHKNSQKPKYYLYF